MKKQFFSGVDFKGFQAPKEQGMRESNSHQRFWRPLSYHLTNPLYVISVTVAIIHIKATFVKLLYAQLQTFGYEQVAKRIANIRLNM